MIVICTVPDPEAVTPPIEEMESVAPGEAEKM